MPLRIDLPPDAACLWHVSTEAEQEFPLVGDDHRLIVVVFSGEFYFTVDTAERTSTVVRGQREETLLLPTNQGAKAITQVAGQLLVLRVPKEDRAAMPSTFPSFSPRDAPFLWRMARVLRGEMLGNGDVHQHFVDVLIRAMDRWIEVNTTNVVKRFEPETATDDSIIFKAVESMHMHIGERFRVDQVASALGLRAPNFGRGFKRKTGLSPSQFFMRMRIDYAKQMLDEDHTLTETWTHCGFYDQPHFTRHFKQIVGVSPTRFLQMSA